MKWTIDTYTGKRFRYNSTVILRKEDGSEVRVPARDGKRDSVWLDDTRVSWELLAELNGWTKVDR